MSISVLGNNSNDDMSNELTFALLTLDKITSYENYCKFRGTPRVKTKEGGIQPVERLEEKLRDYKKVNGIQSCEEAIRRYFVEHGIITNAEIEAYNQAYFDVIASMSSDFKYEYATTKEFKAIVAAFCINTWKFDAESKRILNNFMGIEATNLAKYVVDNSGKLYCGENFDEANHWALMVCNNIIKFKEVDVRNIIKPKSNIRISSGENDDFDITSNLELEKIDLDKIKGFDKIANSIYEANKRLFYTSNSGMFYSLVRLEKDRKRTEINKALMNVMTKYKLSEIRKTFNNLNKTNGVAYTSLPNVKMHSDSFKKVVSNRVKVLQVYEDYSPLSSDKICDCYKAVQAKQLDIYNETLNKNNDLIMPIPGVIDLKNKGATPETIHAVISMGLNALDNFINKLSDLGLTILDVPDRIFYDKSYIRRFKSFSDYMRYYELVDELVKEDKHEVLTLPNSKVPIIDNENLIPSYEKRFLTETEYVGVDLVPLKTLLSKSKFYSLSEEGKNSRLNEDADFKTEFINNLNTAVLQVLRREISNFNLYTTGITNIAFVNELIKLPGKYASTAYNVQTGNYDLADCTEENKGVMLMALKKFLKVSQLYLASVYKIPMENGKVKPEYAERLTKITNTFLANIYRACGYKTAKDINKVIYGVFKYMFIANYINNMLCDFMADIIRESGGIAIGDTSKQIVSNKDSVPRNLSYLSAMKLFQKYKELFDLFIENKNDTIKLVNKELDIYSMTNSPYFSKLSVCHWLVPTNNEVIDYRRDEVANQMLKLIKSIIPPTLVKGVIGYYENIINKFKEGGLGKIDKFAPYTLELNLMSRQLYTVMDSRKLPEGAEVDSNGYYVYGNQAVIVERAGNRGYVHSTGNVVFPEHDHRIENFSEPFSNRHTIVAPFSLISADLYN